MVCQKVKSNTLSSVSNHSLITKRRDSGENTSQSLYVVRVERRRKICVTCKTVANMVRVMPESSDLDNGDDDDDGVSWAKLPPPTTTSQMATPDVA